MPTLGTSFLHDGARKTRDYSQEGGCVNKRMGEGRTFKIYLISFNFQQSEQTCSAPTFSWDLSLPLHPEGTTLGD